MVSSSELPGVLLTAIKDEEGSNNESQKLMMSTKDPTANHLNESILTLTDITAEFSEEEEDDMPLSEHRTHSSKYII